MTGWHLFRWVLVRGLISGALLGAAFLSVGLFWGAVLGIVFGTVDGIALVLMTNIVFTPLHDLQRYHLSALLVSMATTFAVSLLWASGVDANGEFTLILSLVATVTAGLFALRLPVPPIKQVSTQPAHALLFYTRK